MASRLRINLMKTKLIGVGSLPDLQLWASQFGCGLESLPSKYLGMPLGANPRSLSLWDPVVEAFEKRLGIWQSKLLSKAEKLTLIKSTLSNLPIYYLSVFRAPAKIIQALERKIMNFLWDQNEFEKNYHLVNWLQICNTKEVSGLGIKQLKIMNHALLAKWCWRYGSETSALWRRIVVEKFGSSSTTWHPKSSRLSQGVGCWLRIITIKEKMNANQTFKVNSGSNVRLWWDSWLSSGPLKLRYPNLFHISSQKQRTIREVTVLEFNKTMWNLQFFRTLTALEFGELENLLIDIASPPDLSNSVEDVRLWSPTSSHKFTVASCYTSFSSPFEPIMDFPTRFIWNKKIPPRIKFFIWLAVLNKSLTVDNLHKRGRKIVSRCFFCKRNVETIDHLLLHCPFSWSMWCLFLPNQHWSWCVPGTLVSLVHSWNSPSTWSEKARALWSIIPAAVCWGLWKERNLRTFQSQESTFLQVLNNIQSLIHSWSSHMEASSDTSFAEIAYEWEEIFVPS